MDKKYIIKNCPSLKTTEYYLKGRLITERICTFDREEFRLCQNCTDCLLKQVAVKATETINTTFNNECFEFAKDILNMFEIEEA